MYLTSRDHASLFYLSIISKVSSALHDELLLELGGPPFSIGSTPIERAGLISTYLDYSLND